jgi:hypothetical protein
MHLNGEKMGWVTLRAIFSRTHPVTLSEGHVSLKLPMIILAQKQLKTLFTQLNN